MSLDDDSQGRSQLTAVGNYSLSASLTMAGEALSQWPVENKEE